MGSGQSTLDASTPKSKEAVSNTWRPSRPRWQSWASAAGAVLISIVTIAVLLALVEVDLADVSRLASRLNWQYAALLLLLFSLTQLMRIARLGTTLRTPVRASDLTSAALIHQFFLALLPYKLGEISLPLLLRRYEVKAAQSIAVLLLVRLLDLVVSATLLTLALLVFWQELPVGLQRAWPVAVLVGVGSLGLLAGIKLLDRSRSSSADATAGVNDQIPRQRLWIRDRLLGLLDELQATPIRQLIIASGLTLALWGAMLAYNMVFCLRFAPQLSTGTVAVIVLIMPLINNIPIRGLAGIGTTEAVAVVVFTMVGLSPTDAFALGIWGHVFHYTLVGVGGGLGFLIRSQPVATSSN